MAELLEAVASWWSLFLVVVVFGFAPGFFLRLIVLAYPRNDPRRAELIAELYAVPRIQRPLWVAEQLEVALFEGLGHRVSAAIRWLADWRRARVRTDKRGVRVRRWRRRRDLVSWLLVVTTVVTGLYLLVITIQDSRTASVIIVAMGGIIGAALPPILKFRILQYLPQRLRSRRDRTM